MHEFGLRPGYDPRVESYVDGPSGNDRIYHGLQKGTSAARFMLIARADNG